MDLSSKSHFAIEDLMLGEVLGHAGVLREKQLVQIIQLAKKWQLSLGATLCGTGILNAEQLYRVRKLVSGYIKGRMSIEELLERTITKLPRPAMTHQPELRDIA